MKFNYQFGKAKVPRKELFYYLIYLLCSFHFLSCSNDAIYKPVSVDFNTPKQQGEILLSGGVDICSSGGSASMAFSTSPIKNLGIQVYYERLNEEDKFNNLGISLGLYKSNYEWLSKDTRKGIHYNIYLGYSHHRVRRIQEDNYFFTIVSNYNLGLYNVSYQDYFIRVGANLSNGFIDFDFYYRPHLIDVQKVRLNEYFENEVYESFAHISEKPFITHDFGLQIAFGNEALKLRFSYNRSLIPKERISYQLIDPFSFSYGLTMNLCTIYKYFE